MTHPDPSDIAGLAEASPDLRHAGAVVDQAVDYMTKQNIDPVAIASALLGGALGMLTMHLTPEAVLAVLDQARASVESGKWQAWPSLRRRDMPDLLGQTRQIPA